MPTPKTIIDARLLEIMDGLKNSGAIRFYQEFYDKIIISKQNIYKIRAGEMSFSMAQVYAACKNYNINPGYLMNFDKNKFRIK